MTYKLRKLGKNFYALVVFDMGGKIICLNSGGKAHITKVGDEMHIFLEDDFKRIDNEYKRDREKRMFVLRQEERVLART